MIEKPAKKVSNQIPVIVKHCYIHIPFCHHICPYCAFYKHTPGKLANDEFIQALLVQLRSESEFLSPKLETLYLGGGTPSLLSVKHLETLFEGLNPHLSDETEVTLEANPATFDLKKARLIREMGVNRISLGVQSFQSSVLATLGRDHKGRDGREAFEILREAGFENISVDLMFSIPGQDKELWISDLKTVTCDLKPEHVSCYNLTYEEDTEFLKKHERGELDASEDRDADLFYLAKDHLEAAGFHHYEISNYAKPGFESRHNRAYWAGKDYLGIGPGAVGTIDGKRAKTLPDTAAFIGNPSLKIEMETLSEEDRRIEAIAMQLRTSDGVEDSRLNSVESLTKQGLVEKRNGRICLTRAGQALADPIAAQMI